MHAVELCSSVTQAMLLIRSRVKAGLPIDDGGHVAPVERRAYRILSVITEALTNTPDGQWSPQLRRRPYDPKVQDELSNFVELSVTRNKGFEDKLESAIRGTKRTRRFRLDLSFRLPKVAAKQLLLLVSGCLLLLWGAFGLTLSKALSGPVTAWTVFSMAVEKATLICAGVLLIGVFAKIDGTTKAQRGHAHRHVQQVSLGAVRKLQVDAAQDMMINALQAQFLALSVLRPADVRQRVTETYTPNGGTIKQAVTIEAQLPRPHFMKDGRLPEDLRSVYFPVLIPRKGTFQDNFDVRGADGTSLRRLTYREYLKLVACTLRILLATGFSPRTTQRPELHALLDVAQRRRCDGDMSSRRSPAGWERLDKMANADNRPAVAKVAGLLAASLARKLQGHYAVVVAVAPDEGGRFIVRYEQTLLPSPSRNRKMAGMSRALGARPVQLEVGLDNAASCQSYHAQANCPDYLFLGRQELSLGDQVLETVREDAPTPVHLRLRKRFGQPHGHLYSRFFPESPERSTLKFTFYEVPPASVFRAAITAVTAFLLVLAVGVVMSREPDAGTDAPAILLAFPAVAAALVGFDKPQRSILDSTLAARCSLMITAVLSVVASALFMVTKVLKYDWPHLPLNWSLIGVTSVFWVMLTGVAFINTCMIVWVCISRFSFYAYLNSRNPEELQHEEVGDVDL
ncbi:hypothetical protein [Amycolatopsis sp. NPDC003861]